MVECSFTNSVVVGLSPVVVTMKKQISLATARSSPISNLGIPLKDIKPG